MKRRIVSVVGTRPNLMKIAPVAAALRARPDDFEHVLVHTGQHYEFAMSDIFLSEFGMGEPDAHLGVGSGTQAEQIVRIIDRLRPVLSGLDGDLVLVPGDVNSTLEAALTASELSLPLGHIEAGLRSFDYAMPEELNRVLTDRVSDLLFIHSPEARENLLAEGRPAAAIRDVGNTMIDTLVALEPAIDATRAPEKHGLERGTYLVVTLHRPALVDGHLLAEVLNRLERLAELLPVILPAHPRTRRAIEASAWKPAHASLQVLPPLGYLEFVGLVSHARGVLTDSGGVQEETTYLGIPCFTLRDNTERPVTVSQGTNILLGLSPERIADIPELLERSGSPSRAELPGWDGRASTRIADALDEFLDA
jgi:UDP-N-acetylglucosamine 2-epimerase (non-hydrolysing)